MKKIILINSHYEITIYDTLQEAASQNKLEVSDIKSALLTGSQTHVGFFIKYNIGSFKKPVAQISKKYNSIIAIYNNPHDATIKTGITNIGNCAKGNANSAGGYYWEYLDLNSENIDFLTRKNNFEKSEYILLYNDTNNFAALYRTIQEAEIDTLMQIDIIKQSIANNTKTEAGFFIKYSTKHKPKPVLQIDMLELTVIKAYSSVYEAKLKTSINNIADCAKGKAKSAGGYYWKFINIQ